MIQPGYDLTSILLPDGKALVTGFGASPSGANCSELYDPITQTWTDTAPMPASDSFGTAVLLATGKVLAIGGSAALLYDPATDTWSATASKGVARRRPTATLLPSGDVLVTVGDSSYGGGALASAEIYSPTLLAVSPAKGPVATHITVRGSGFYADEAVTVRWDGGQVLARARTGTTGSFTAKVTVPSSATGTHTLSAQGARSFANAQATFVVRA